PGGPTPPSWRARRVAPSSAPRGPPRRPSWRCPAWRGWGRPPVRPPGASPSPAPRPRAAPGGATCSLPPQGNGTDPTGAGGRQVGAPGRSTRAEFAEAAFEHLADGPEAV